MENIGTKGTQRRMKRRSTILSILLLAVFCQTAFAQEEFKLTVVFLVRHAEKEDEPKQDPPLKKEGVARSQELARILSTANIKAIYTSQFIRTKQTAEPLTAKTGVSVTALTLKPNPSNLRLIAEESTAELVNKILQRPGDNALVIGHSNWIPDVIKMLGGDIVPTIDEQKFDDLFIVTVYGKGKAKVVQLKYGAP
jgi:phosphohistidine phosphatase SixA